MVTYYRRDNIGIVEFNDPDSRVNLLSNANLDGLGRIIDDIEGTQGLIKALFFISGKQDVFLAGADIKELAAIRTREEALGLCKKGQDLFDRIERLTIPTFALVDGACVGGGFELALSCRYILATKNKKVRIGLPESKLGIAPGFGGPHRLAKRMGAAGARGLIDTGRLLNFREARQFNIVDRIIADSKKASYQTLMKICRRPGVRFENQSVTENSDRDANKSEREILAEKILQEPARNSLSSYLLVSRYRNQPLLKDADEKTLPVKSCAVIGAGTMGRGIAYLLSSEGDLPVGLKEIDSHILKKAKKDIKNLYNDAVKRGILYKNEAKERFKRISFNGSQLIDADLVIESITEGALAKKQLFAEIEKDLKRDCILATNTSCLSVEELSKPLERAGRFIGIHFFNPAYKMKLVEVVATSFTSSSVLETVVTFLRQLKRIPIIVKDSPGFLVNRMLLPYLNEAVFMLEEGIDPGNIDNAMLRFGMPVGPLRLLEEIGLEVAYKASKILEDNFGSRMRVPETLRARSAVRDRISNRQSSRPSPEQIQGRLLGPMRREARLCLEEGVVANREIIDLALLLGIGFPASKRLWV